MPGGNKSIVFNPRERCASDDVNRLQRLAMRERAELLHQLIDATSTEDQSAGFVTLGLATTAPLRAVIINGLLPQPGVGDTSLSIGAGVIAMINPDVVVDADDSALKVVTMPGLGAGTLTMTANTSGSTRVDIIECARLPDQVVETDSRDVFDPVTGLFSPQGVNKVVVDQLQYRIRLGTPGGGFPGTTGGWLPLMVAAIPTGSLNWDTANLWDVRPLLSDTARPLMRITQPYPHAGMQYALAETPDTVARNVTGVVELELGGRRVGGNFNVAPLGALNIKENNASVVEPGFTPGGVAGTPWFLYLAFPFGLPRWCMTQPASSGNRLPAGLRGIPVYTQKASSHLNGQPDVNLTLPSGLGLGGAVTVTPANAVMALAGTYDDISGAWNGSLLSGRECYAPSIQLARIGALDPSTNNYTVSCTGKFPGRAVKLLLQIATIFFVSGTAGNAVISLFTRQVLVLNSGGARFYIVDDSGQPYTRYSADTTPLDTYTIWVPILPHMPDGDQSISRTLRLIYQGAGTITSQTVRVIGWELGP